MSYILEALADSEQARLQIAAAPRYSLLPAVGEEIPRARVWPYALAGALLVNAAVLQLWLRPATPGSVATIKAPGASAAAEAAVAAAQPRILPSGKNEKPAADLAEIAPRETGLPLSKPARAHELRAAAAPADPSSGTRSANVASASLMHAPGPAAKVTAKRKAELAVASGAAPTGVAKVAAASEAAVVATAPVVANAAKPTAGLAAVAAPALAATASAADSELPPALQQELPVLAVAGFIRDDGSSGMVIVNDSLAREGDEVAPGVKLERIAGDSLVFNYKGYRFKR